LINMLKQNGYDEVGCLGFSVGGYISGVLACTEKNLDYCFCLASSGDYPVLLKYYKEKDNKKKSSDSNTNFNFVKKYSPLIAPINYKRVVDKDNIIFFNGIFYTRVPFKSILKLKNAWGNPRVVVYPCGHFTFFLFNGITQRIFINHLSKDRI